MAKLEIVNLENVFTYNFIQEDGSIKSLKFSKQSHDAIKNYFNPIQLSYSKTIPEFDELWKMHPKGNKKTAKDRFIKVMKKVSFLDLKSKLEPYVKSNDFVYLKGLDVWLNPEKEHWEDLVVKKEDKFKKEEPVKPKFFS